MIISASFCLLINTANAELKTFTSPDAGYSFSYPDELNLSEDKSDNSVKLTNENTILYISISSFDNSAEGKSNMEEGVNEGTKELQSQGFTLIGTEDYSLKGYKGKRVKLTKMDNNQKIRVDYFYLDVNNVIYMIVVSSTEALFEFNFEKVKQILDSLQFKSQNQSN